MASDQDKAGSVQPETGGSKMTFGDHQGIDAFSQATLREIMSISKVSNEIPCDETFALYSSFPAFKQIMDMEGKKCIELIGKMFKKYNVGGGLTHRDLDEKFDLVIEANDQLLEKINGDLDEAAGIKKKLDTVVQTVVASADGAVSGRWNVSTNRTLARSASTVRLMTASNIERPQLTFRHKVDNSPAPFEPILTDKPHSLRPLAVLLEIDDEGRERFSHPYEFELERFQPAEWALAAATEPVPPPPADQTGVTMVASVPALQQLVRELAQCRELAVDLEHHNYRSYLGLTCLMQISTRERDYIVDTLQLRGQLQPLNEVFANPAIVKVFHGADSDVEWLQRDCGLYLVNMFDTHQASKVLAFPRLSLAYLLQHFCNVAADKRLQLADWRIRPLPEDMVRYAQEDTHYLLYIYDRMRNLLLEKGNEQKNLLRSVYTNSTLVCLKSYRKPALRPDSHLDMYRRSKKSFNNKQLSALAQLFKWRDGLARLEDESTQYVLPNHMLLQICELLPRELQGLLACCSPVPPLLRANLATAHKLVLAARSLAAVIETKPNSTILVQAPTKSRSEYSSILHNPHDNNQTTGDDRVNVPLLLTSAAADQSMDTSTAEESAVVPAPTKRTPDLDVYPLEAVQPSEVGSSWISPYRRYLMMKDTVDDEKVVRRMAELTERTPTRAPRPAGPSSPLPEPEAVLPGLKAEHADKVAVDDDEKEEKEPPVPQKLRLSRKDVVREQKTAGTYRKAHKRKHAAGGAEGGPVAPPTIPLSEAPPAQRARPAGTWSAEPATTPLPPDPFDYATVDYRKFVRPDDDGAARGGKRGRGRGGRGRGRGGKDSRGGRGGGNDSRGGGRGKRGKNPWQQEGGRQQTFGGGGGRGRP